MTTVAWDSNTLAADSQSTAADLVCSLVEQKIYTPNYETPWFINGTEVHAIGLSGDCGAEFELLEKLTQGITYSTEFLPTAGFSVIAVCGRRHAYVISKNEGSTQAQISLQVDPYAIGSGSTVARTAMKLGRDAHEAVRVAIEMDIYSGGSIQVYTCN